MDWISHLSVRPWAELSPDATRVSANVVNSRGENIASDVFATAPRQFQKVPGRDNLTVERILPVWEGDAQVGCVKGVPPGQVVSGGGDVILEGSDPNSS